MQGIWSWSPIEKEKKDVQKIFFISCKSHVRTKEVRSLCFLAFFVLDKTVTSKSSIVQIAMISFGIEGMPCLVPKPIKWISFTRLQESGTFCRVAFVKNENLIEVH